MGGFKLSVTRLKKCGNPLQPAEIMVVSCVDEMIKCNPIKGCGVEISYKKMSPLLPLPTNPSARSITIDLLDSGLISLLKFVCDSPEQLKAFYNYLVEHGVPTKSIEKKKKPPGLKKFVDGDGAKAVLSPASRYKQEQAEKLAGSSLNRPGSSLYQSFDVRKTPVKSTENYSNYQDPSASLPLRRYDNSVEKNRSTLGNSVTRNVPLTPTSTTLYQPHSSTSRASISSTPGTKTVVASSPYSAVKKTSKLFEKIKESAKEPRKNLSPANIQTPPNKRHLTGTDSAWHDENQMPLGPKRSRLPSDDYSKKDDMLAEFPAPPTRPSSLSGEFEEKKDVKEMNEIVTIDDDNEDFVRSTWNNKTPYGFRGMDNLGNSCYMNACLQALASSPDFIRCLLNAVPQYDEDYEELGIPKQSELLITLARIYRHIFSFRPIHRQYDKENNVPRSQLRRLRKAAGEQLDSDFGTGNQQDGHEFMFMLIDYIKDEIDLKKGPAALPPKPADSNEDKLATKENENPEPEKEEGEITEDEVTEEYPPELAAFAKTCTNLPSTSRANPADIFTIDCVSRVGCDRCGTKSEDRIETALDLQVGIKEGYVSIKSLITSQLEREDIEYNCDRCGNKGPGFMTTAFTKLPECLIVVVKRYSYGEYGGQKCEQPIEVDRELFLKDLCDGSEKKMMESVPRRRSTGGLNGAIDVKTLSESVTSLAHVSPAKPVSNFCASPRKGLITESPRKARLSCSQSDAGETAAEIQKSQRDLYGTQKSSQSSVDLFSSQSDGEKQEEMPERGGDENLDMEDDDDDITLEAMEKQTTQPTIRVEPIAVAGRDDSPLSPEKCSKQTGGGPVDASYSPFYNEEDDLYDENQETERIAEVPEPEKSHSGESVVEDGVKMTGRIWWNVLGSEKIKDIQFMWQYPEKSLDDIEAWRTNNLFTSRVPMQSKGVSPKEQVIEGDGNCLFRCISYYIFNGSQEHHDIIRGSVCDFLEKFPNEFKVFLSDEVSIEEHIMSMKDNKTWGTHLEMHAMATMFRCTIYSYFNGSWTLFSPRFEWRDMFGGGFEKLDDTLKSPDPLRQEGGIFLVNNYNSHFNVAVAPSEAKWMEFSNNNNQEMDPGAAFDEPVVDYPLKNIRFDNFDKDYGVSQDLQELFVQPTYEYQEEDDPVYTLSAVVNHRGHSLRYGHYTCFAFDTERNVWLDCNDSRIHKTDENEVLEKAASLGYMFIYRRRHAGDTKQFQPAPEDCN